MNDNGKQSAFVQIAMAAGLSVGEYDPAATYKRAHANFRCDACRRVFTFEWIEGFDVTPSRAPCRDCQGWGKPDGAPAAGELK